MPTTPAWCQQETLYHCATKWDRAKRAVSHRQQGRQALCTLLIRQRDGGSLNSELFSGDLEGACHEDSCSPGHHRPPNLGELPGGPEGLGEDIAEALSAETR